MISTVRKENVGAGGLVEPGRELEILSEIGDIETIASGRSVHIRRYLDRTYGVGVGER